MIAYGGDSGIVNILKEWGFFVMYDNYTLIKGVPNLDNGEDSILHWAVDDPMS